MEETNNRNNKFLLFIGILALFLVIGGASYAYFAVSTINNFGTTTINAVAGEIGSVTLNGSNAQLNLSVTALDMAQGSNDITYYASSSGTTTTETEEVIGTATVTPNTDTTIYHCTYTLSVTHTGTNDMYTAFTNGANKSTGQIILTINGVDYDFYDGWPANNQVQGSFYTNVANPANITAGLRLINDSEINQNYLANTDIQITISLVNGSLSCIPEENPIVYINRQNANQITAGDTIAIGDEHFFVVSSDSTNTALLAIYDLKQDGTTYIQDTSGTNSNIIKITFSSSPYWYNRGLVSMYSNASNAANTTAFVSPYPYVYDSNSNLYSIVNQYANMISTNLGINIRGRLLNYEEAENLVTSRKDYNNSIYWLGSASSSPNPLEFYDRGDFIWGVTANGVFSCTGYLETIAVRPVIVISTSYIPS